MTKVDLLLKGQTIEDLHHPLLILGSLSHQKDREKDHETNGKYLSIKHIIYSTL